MLGADDDDLQAGGRPPAQLQHPRDHYSTVTQDQSLSPFIENYINTYCFQRGRILQKLLTIKQKSCCCCTKEVKKPFWKTPSYNLFEPTEAFQQKISENAEKYYKNEANSREYLFPNEVKNQAANLKMIDIKQVRYDKPILIIYNPISGKKTDLREAISAYMKKEQIPFELYVTTAYRDSFMKARDFDIDQYSALGACGGDGTLHEVLNGMLKRKDKKRLPLAFIGNGSGNDFLRNFEVTDYRKSLQFIKVGNVIKIDVMRLLIDCESEEEAAASEDIDKHLMYSQLCVNFCFPPLVTYSTPRWLKSILGGEAYTIQIVREIRKGRLWNMSIDFDDGKLQMNNKDIQYLPVYNGKYYAAGCPLNQLASLNDGLIECVIPSRFIPTGEFLGAFGDAKKGISAYVPTFEYYRFSNMRITNENKDEKGQPTTEFVDVDGEPHKYSKFMKIDTLKQEVELIVDFDYIFQEQYMHATK